MRYIKQFFIILCSLFVFCACSNKYEDYAIPDCTKRYMEYCGISTYNIQKLGNYEKLRLEVADVSVSDREISDNIADLLESYAYTEPVEDRITVVDGDFVTISYEVYEGKNLINNVSGDMLKVGAGYYNEDIESELVGKNIGDTFEIIINDVTDNKEKILNVTVNSIQKFVTFSLQDENFLNNVLGYSSEDELKNAVKEQIRQTKESEAQSEAEHKLLLKIIDDSDIEFNEKEVAEYAKQQVELYEQIASANNLSLEEYYTQNLKLNIEEFYQKCYNDAEEELAEELVIGAIAELENIQVEDEVPEKESELTWEEIIQNNVKNQQNLRKKVFETVF